MDQDFVVEQADSGMIRVTHRVRAATLTFMISGRKLLGSVASDGTSDDLALDSDARAFAKAEALRRGLIDADPIPPLQAAAHRDEGLRPAELNAENDD